MVSSPTKVIIVSLIQLKKKSYTGVTLVVGEFGLYNKLMYFIAQYNFATNIQQST